MKHTLSDADKLELKTRIFETLSEENPTGDVLNERHAQGLLRMFDEYYAAKNTFSDWIKNNEDQWSRFCPTCERWFVARLLHFPKLMMRYLHILAHYGVPMTVKQIEEKSGVPRSYDESSHFPLLKHWNLIEKVEGTRQYIATPKALAVLRGQEPVNEWVWIFNDERIQPPPQELDGEPKLIADIKHKTFTDDQIYESVSAFLIY